MAAPAPLRTDRLELHPCTADDVRALRRGDRGPLERALDARFGDPFSPPPLLGEALPAIEERLAAHPDEAGWWVWLVVRHDDRRAVGAVGLGGRPDAEGTLVVGYSTYAESAGRGYATEAVRALLAWAFAQPGVERVRATIPPWNAASRRVADKVGLRSIGLIWDEELGEDVELRVRQRAAG